MKRPLLKVSGIAVFCTCRMPEHGFMFTCTATEIKESNREFQFVKV